MFTLKSSVLACAAASTLCFAGDYYVVAVEPLVPAPPMSQNPWWMEAAAFYGFASEGLFKDASANVGHVNSYGADLTLGRNFCGKTHAWDIRFGYGYGDNKKADGFTDLEGLDYDVDAKLHRFYLMPGYRYTMELSPCMDAFVGLNLGVDNSSIKTKLMNETGSLHAHKADWGFAYSAEIGLKYYWSKCMYSFLAYQFQGSTATPHLHADGQRIDSRVQCYHSIRAGLGWEF